MQNWCSLSIKLKGNSLTQNRAQSKQDALPYPLWMLYLHCSTFNEMCPCMCDKECIPLKTLQCRQTLSTLECASGCTLYRHVKDFTCLYFLHLYQQYKKHLQTSHYMLFDYIIKYFTNIFQIMLYFFSANTSSVNCSTKLSMFRLKLPYNWLQIRVGGCLCTYNSMLRVAFLFTKRCSAHSLENAQACSASLCSYHVALFNLLKQSIVLKNCIIIKLT